MGNPVPDNSENVQLCTCPTCPTYKKSSLSGTLFCARGKASQKVEAADCICPNCPIFETYGLNQMYYCIQGKSVDLKP